MRLRNLLICHKTQKGKTVLDLVLELIPFQFGERIRVHVFEKEVLLSNNGREFLFQTRVIFAQIQSSLIEQNLKVL